MKNTLRRFFDALDTEERTVAAPLSDDSLGLTLRSAINELDWYYYNLARTTEPTDDAQEQFYILQLGTCRLIHLALVARSSFDVPVVMFPRNRDLTLRVLATVSALGMIQHGRRVAQAVPLGIATVEELAEKRFVFKLPLSVPDDEYYERAVREHYYSESRHRFVSLLKTDAGKEVEAMVSSKLDELVFPFARHFIGYGADPLLDEFFFGLAYHDVQLQEGFDTFHYATRFGGVRFQNYILALTFVMATAFRHQRFAEALVRKDTSVRLENVLTISADTAVFVESLRDAVNDLGSAFKDFEEISLDDAATVLRVLSCRRGNTAICEAPGSPLPLLIQCSDEGLIKCLTGAHSEPMRFLLESLRFHYPREYDSNQQGREESLQRSIQRVLDGGFDGLEYRPNIRARRRGQTLTDIDLAIIDSRTGIVILSQIKHQELYGANLHAKRIRGERLRSQVADWLAAVDEWEVAVGERGLREALRVPSSCPPLRVYRLIVTRHFCYPLEQLVLGQDTMYATWPQFFNAVQLVTEKHRGRDVRMLVEVLRETRQSAEPVTHVVESPVEWTINDLRFVVQHGEAPVA